jgi:hypothetical protein
MDSLKRKLLFVSVLFSSLIVNAQQVEVGLMLGASNYLGDLSNETFVMKESHFSGSLFGRYNFSPRFALKGNFGYARVSGDDKNFVSEKRDYVLNQVLTQDFEFNKARNLNFFSDIYEFSLHGEFNLLPNDLNAYSARPFVPYVFMGIGIFNFNPKTTYNNNTLTKCYTFQPSKTIENLTLLPGKYKIIYRTHRSLTIYGTFEKQFEIQSTDQVQINL